MGGHSATGTASPSPRSYDREQYASLPAFVWKSVWSVHAARHLPALDANDRVRQLHQAITAWFQHRRKQVPPSSSDQNIFAGIVRGLFPNHAWLHRLPQKQSMASVRNRSWTRRRRRGSKRPVAREGLIVSRQPDLWTVAVRRRWRSLPEYNTWLEAWLSFAMIAISYKLPVPAARS